MTTSRPGCLGILFALFRGKDEAPVSDLPYRLRDDFLSPAERSFYGVLHQVAGDRFVICPKVNLADIVFVARPHEHTAARNRIDRKHVDFVLCDPATLRPRAAIELDDASHQRPDRQARDSFVDQVFAAVGLPLLRFPVRPAYTVQELTERLTTLTDAVVDEDAPPAPTSPASPPTCPKCSIPLVRRTATKGANAGEPFYGCANFPRCRETAPVLS